MSARVRDLRSPWPDSPNAWLGELEREAEAVAFPVGSFDDMDVRGDWWDAVNSGLRRAPEREVVCVVTVVETIGFASASCDCGWRFEAESLDEVLETASGHGPLNEYGVTC